MRPLAVLAFVSLLALSGCLREPYVPEKDPDVPGAVRFEGGWASLEEARIRPGALVLVMTDQGGGACTSNFLFRSPDNLTLYLGIAAHCFGPPDQAAPLGTYVDIGGVPRAGRIAYNGWLLDASDANDFGLIELRNDRGVRPLVNPAMLHWGGPTGLATEAAPGAHVITYGHSVQRAPDDPENPREGYVVESSGGRTTVVTDHPGIQGDSGSGLMTADGRALGVLSMGTTNPTNGLVRNRDFPSVNYYVDLDQALAYAAANGPPELQGLEVVTAPMLAQPELPLAPMALPAPLPAPAPHPFK